MNYTQGDLIELPAEFRDADTNTLTDPDTLSLRVSAPDNTVNTYTYPGASISRTSLGVFLGVVAGDQAGSYQYEWVLSGNIQGVEPGSFYVEVALPDAAAYRRVRGQLARMVAASSEPVLDVETLDDLLFAARTVDRWKLRPEDAGWTPSYDLHAAAAAGWETKAGLAAGDYNFAASGQRFDRSQVHTMCLAMADRQRRRVVKSVSTSPSANDDLLGGGVRVNG